jgi:TnpA family transposase
MNSESTKVIPSVSSEKRKKLVTELWEGIIKTLQEIELSNSQKEKLDREFQKHFQIQGTISLRALTARNPLFKIYHE